MNFLYYIPLYNFILFYFYFFTLFYLFYLQFTLFEGAFTQVAADKSVDTEYHNAYWIVLP